MTGWILRVLLVSSSFIDQALMEIHLYRRWSSFAELRESSTKQSFAHLQPQQLQLQNVVLLFTLCGMFNIFRYPNIQTYSGIFTSTSSTHPIGVCVYLYRPKYLFYLSCHLSLVFLQSPKPSTVFQALCVWVSYRWVIFFMENRESVTLRPGRGNARETTQAKSWVRFEDTERRDRTQQIDNQESRSITSGSSGQFCLKTNREKNGSELTRIHNITAAFLPEDGMYWQIYLNFRSSEKAGKWQTAMWKRKR